MISKDKTYRTQDGREVRIYATDGFGNQCVHGAYRDKNGEWAMWLWGINGEPTNIIKYGEDALDLIEVKPRHKRTVWLNVYGEHISVHEEKYHADASITINSWVGGTLDRIACIKVDLDFEEGEGLR